MELPVTLQKKIIAFLTSLPNIHDTESQRAFIYHAGFDPQLRDQITFGKPPAQFVPLLVSILIKYGKLHDGRHALQAVLEAARSYVGQKGRAQSEQLLRELQAVVDEKSENPMHREPAPSVKPSSRESAPTNTQTISIGGNASGNIFQSGNRSAARIQHIQGSSQLSENINIQAEFNIIQRLLTQLHAPNQRKIENALSDVAEELLQSSPDREEVGQALERALNYARHAPDFADIVNQLNPHVNQIAVWLGSPWPQRIVR